MLADVRVFGLLGTALLLVVVGCSRPPAGSNGTTDPDQNAEQGVLAVRRAVLAHLAGEVITPLYADFLDRARALQQATERWRTSGEPADREAAQQTWREAMALWQRAELTQLGPAGAMGQVAGGEDLRDEIYAWPLGQRCFYDRVTLDEQYDDLASLPVNRRGLGALEYLLFVEEPGNGCPASSSINAGPWQALGDDEIWRRRGAYAAAAAADVAERAEALHTAWASGGGKFQSQLAGAGSGSEVYSSTQEALNALTSALFYLEKETKDMKLAQPAGLKDCDAMTCPAALESPWSGTSRDNILANLAGFELVFTGGPGDVPGFDSLLVAAGQKALAEAMTSDIATARAKLQGLDPDLAVQLVQDPDAVVDAHGALQGLVTRLKTEFVSVLDLELPRRVEGDND